MGMEKIRMDNKMQLLISLFVILMIAIYAVIVVYALAYEPFERLPENERILNAYATFESTCAYRGYDRDECLQIWSGR